MLNLKTMSKFVQRDVLCLLGATLLSITIFIVGLWAMFGVSIFPQKVDSMADLMSGRPKAALVELDFEARLGGNKTNVLKIDDTLMLDYINHHGFHADVFRDQYRSGSRWPFDAVFVFSDGSRYHAVVAAVVDIPNKPGFLIVTYPINPFSLEEIDDKRYVLDLDVATSRRLYARLSRWKRETKLY